MISWKKQGAAIVGGLSLQDGRAANVVLVGSRQNPKGAVVVAPAADGGQLQTLMLNDALDWLAPSSVIEIMCMQELVFGDGQLKSLIGQLGQS